MNSWSVNPKWWVFFALAVSLAGCGRGNIEVYRIAKEQPGSQPQPGMPPGQPETGGGTEAPRIQFAVPAGWEQAAPGEMRVASFHVQKEGKQADIGVVPLPGLMGRDLDNVNRWRSTVGLAPVEEAELGKLAQPVQVGDQTAQLYEQAGENPGSGEKTRILAAVLKREGVAWFFKMMGDDELVAHQKPEFIKFVQSVSFQAAAPAGQPELPPSHPPIGDSAMGAAQAAAGPSAPKPNWQVPTGWQEVAGGPFLVSKFLVSGAEGTAVNVSMSPGTGGGVAGNINRWRGQLGLGELSESEISKLVTTVETPGGKAMLVDLSGTDARSGKKARLIGAIVPQTNQTWFYKLMGDEQAVLRERSAFSNFIQTAKYPNAS